MGATGKTSKTSEVSEKSKPKRESYLSKSQNLSKDELRSLFSSDTGINTTEKLYKYMSKQNLAQFYDDIRDLDDDIYNEFGVHVMRELDGGASKGAVASASWYRGTDKFPIQFASQYIKDLEYFRDTMKEEVRGFHPISNDGVRSTVAHEIGHLFASRIINQEFSDSRSKDMARLDYTSKFKSFKSKYTKWNTEWARKFLISAYKIDTTKDSWDSREVSRLIDSSSSNISKYATYSYHEAIAEAVSDYMLNGSNSAKESLQIIAEIKRRMK